MPASTLAAPALPALPVLLLVGGMAVLAAALALLVGRRARPGVGTARAAGQRAWTATAPPAPSDAPIAVVACDWAAWWDTGDGERLALRRAVGRACCHYVVGVRELDPVVAPRDDREEALRWAGARTRIGVAGATTPTTRDVITRRVTPNGAGLDVGIAVDRTPGPVVTTPGRRPTVGDHEAVAATPDLRAARVWERHIEHLRDRGARPLPAAGPGAEPVQARRRVELRVRVERGCTTAPHPATAHAHVQAHLAGTASRGGAYMAAPRLAAWVAVDGHVVAADTPTDPPSGLASWSRGAVAGPDAGIRAEVDPSADRCRAAWSGRWEGDVDEAAVVLVAHSTVALEVDAADRGPALLSAQLEGTVSSHVGVRVGQATAGPAARGCTRCLPELVVRLGHTRAPGAGSPAPGRTSEGAIQLDGRVLRLSPPVPDSADRSWVVAQVDLAAGTGAGRPPSTAQPTRALE